MTLVTPELKEGVQKLFEKLSSPEDPAAAMGPTVATATMTGPQTSEAKWPNFTVTSDEPKSVGGRDTAPPPSSIFVASIGFAENVIFARQGALSGLDFESLETKVEAQWDRKGMFGIGEAHAQEVPRDCDDGQGRTHTQEADCQRGGNEGLTPRELVTVRRPKRRLAVPSG